MLSVCKKTGVGLTIHSHLFRQTTRIILGCINILIVSIYLEYDNVSFLSKTDL